MALQALDSCVDSCDPGEFHLGFGTDLAFQSAKENLNPPDSRKRIVQNDKDQPCVEETFVQPDPPKKHKGSHSTQVVQDIMMGSTAADHTPSHMQQRAKGHFMHQENTEPVRFDDKAGLEAVLRELGQDMKMVYLKWAQPFGEGESFEAFCPARLDELLREGQRLEQHLRSQKERLRERLTLLTRTLQMPVR